ncbi:MAG: ABC-F family ATP-binding cassette domain-containing protein [Candidatus Babeliales bacterium]
MIQARDLCLTFGNKTVFDDISFILDEEDRVGLVGRNGSGKTTLLKAIIDQSALDSGTIAITSRKTIAYMPQEVVLQSSLSILDETLTIFASVWRLEQEMALLAQQFEQAPTDALVERYGMLEEQLRFAQPAMLQAKTKKMLMGLGFSVEQFDQPVANLSGGWKMRIVLAKLLLQEADFYLFDEPTNHLDLEAKEWFLDFLKHASFGFLLICHEQYFLDELCERILDLDQGKATWYSGNYSTYVIKKQEDLERLHRAYTQQQKEIKRKEAIIEQFRAGTRAKQAKSMERALEKIERIEIPPASKEVRFSFPQNKQSGKEVLHVVNVAYSFGNKPLFQQVSFVVTRGQKIALIAPNGVGKTTLLNLIAGALPVQKGTINFGYNVTFAFFNQDQNKVLDGTLSIIDNVKNLCATTTESTIRSFLGAFLFSGEEVFKKVGVLSGGEKNRVGMVTVLLQQTNLLLLDEPTNHLDIPSKAILLHALQEFNGTIIFVSHDRDFINALATHVIALTPKGAHCYEGNYDAYFAHRQQ